MLEIIFIAVFTRRIGTIVRAKGYQAGAYQFLAVLAWFAGEVLGAIVGVHLTSGAGVYFFALLGAALGAGSVYALARARPNPYAQA